MDKKIILLVVGLVVFGLGFFAGMEYKAYSIRMALKDVFAGVNTTPNSNTKSTTMEKAKQENDQIVNKNIGDEIAFATISVKVNGVEEKQILKVTYGTPKVAKESTKFVVVNMDVTNITNSAFDFSPDLVIIDDKGREFTSYSDVIGSDEKYLDYRKLSPSIKENGNLIYEVPNDATSYSLLIFKGGTKELYKILLK